MRSTSKCERGDSDGDQKKGESEWALVVRVCVSQCVCNVRMREKRKAAQLTVKRGVRNLASVLCRAVLCWTGMGVGLNPCICDTVQQQQQQLASVSQQSSR